MSARISAMLAGRAVRMQMHNRTLVFPSRRGWGAGINTTSGSVRQASTDSSKPIVEAVSAAVDAVSSNVAETAVEATIGTVGYYPADLVMRFVEYVHLSTGMPYWESIVAITVGVRCIMFPIYIKVQQTTARMAAMKPEMDLLQKSFTGDPRFTTDPSLQSRYQQEMKALWTKHDVNPLRALSLPIIQLPVFISFFQALRTMGDIYPGFTTGGTSFFTDLTAADATMILPVLNSVSFLMMIEMGGEGAAAAQQQTFKLVMRALAVVMIPATMSFPQGLFVYWSANNAVSILQGLVFKIPSVRAALKIPKMPEPSAAVAEQSPFAKFFKAVQKYKADQDAAKIEIIDGVTRPPPPPPPPAGGPKNPSVVTYATNPKKIKTK